MFIMVDLKSEIIGVRYIDTIISSEETIGVQGPLWVRFLGLEVDGCDGVGG